MRGCLWICCSACNIAADDDEESDYDIINNIMINPRSTKKWLILFGARSSSLVNSSSEITSKRRGQPPKIDNIIHVAWPQ
jgi:hypothetical protein